MLNYLSLHFRRQMASQGRSYILSTSHFQDCRPALRLANFYRWLPSTVCYLFVKCSWVEYVWWLSQGYSDQRMQYCLNYSVLVSGRASFWGGAYNVHKWTRNLRTKIQKCAPTKRNRETKAAFQKHLPVSVNKTFIANDVRFPFTYSRMFRDRLCHVLFETESHFLV